MKRFRFRRMISPHFSRAWIFFSGEDRSGKHALISAPETGTPANCMSGFFLNMVTLVSGCKDRKIYTEKEIIFLFMCKVLFLPCHCHPDRQNLAGGLSDLLLSLLQDYVAELPHGRGTRGRGRRPRRRSRCPLSSPRKSKEPSDSLPADNGVDLFFEFGQPPELVAGTGRM